MTHAYIADAVRTPRGRGNDKGSLKPLKPAELLAQTLRALAERTALDTAQVSDAVFGCVSQTGEQGASVGTVALPLAGWNDAVGAVTINRYCASGLSATHFAALQALHGDTLAVGGGIEMMSRVPMGSDQGPLTHDRALQVQAQLVPIGIAADAIATQRSYSRARLDAYAAQSQQRAGAAAERGMPRSMVAVTDAGGNTLLARDENIRPGTTEQTLAALPAAFAEWGAKGGDQGWDALLCRRYGLAAITHVHHAGNSPAMADGAAAVLVGSRGALERAALVPRARILGFADTGSDRTLALTGTVDAARLALQRAGLRPGDIDLFEINEGFAAMALHFMDEMAVPHDRLNVNGGAIAIGHAMGATGAAMVGVMLDALEARDARYGCLSICGAAGVASAMVVERIRGF
ncbi:acetyl-CoA C-acyltransferase [Comamonadaceae bacterium G21597-S1]|nr:acetyl-CoA C-acyltransferase [Comamonadaceae bacterium G21597-S1]